MTTADAALARRLSTRLDTLWDFDYEPTHQELESLYETAKKNQWNATTAIDWSRPLGREGPILNVEVAFQGARFMVCGQLVNAVPELDAKLYGATQVVDEGRHVEVFERYVKKLHNIYPVDPLLKTLIDEILASESWELKLLGMQMLIEGLAIAAFNLMRQQTGDPTLADLLDYVLQDEGRHVNFGYFALKRAIPAMDESRRAELEDFAVRACDAMYGRDAHTGFRSIETVWAEMGWDAEATQLDVVQNAATIRVFNRLLFTGVLIPRLQRLGLLTSRVEPRYREIGLLDA
jgi:hypothetical protein